MLMSRHTSEVFLISKEKNRRAISLLKVGKLHYEWLQQQQFLIRFYCNSNPWKGELRLAYGPRCVHAFTKISIYQWNLFNASEAFWWKTVQLHRHNVSEPFFQLFVKCLFIQAYKLTIFITSVFIVMTSLVRRSHVWITWENIQKTSWVMTSDLKIIYVRWGFGCNSFKCWSSKYICAPQVSQQDTGLKYYVTVRNYQPFALNIITPELATPICFKGHMQRGSPWAA